MNYREIPTNKAKVRPNSTSGSNNEVNEFRRGNAARLSGIGVLNAEKLILIQFSNRLHGVDTEYQ